jgi:signal transduction histidine kinase
MNVRSRRQPNQELQSLEERQRDLEDLDLDLSTFVYNASHDLKAPLASISGLLAFCQEDLEGGSIDDLRVNLRRAIDLCAEGSKRIDAVFKVVNLEDYGARIDEFSCRSLLEEVLDAHAEIPDVELQMGVHGGDTVRLNRAATKLILGQLVSNAVRFRDVEKAKASVWVSTNLTESGLKLCVRDNGIGIPENRHKDLFRMFRKIHDKSGDCVGLAMVKRQVSRMMGKISFNSVEREGTEFCVDLPINSTIRP